jgi:hypothetical protein
VDSEAGTSATTTRLTLVLSKKALQEKLEFKMRALVDFEDKDCYIMPGVTWTEDAISAEFSGGIFAGDKNGDLGQYRDNYYLKALLKYQF